VARPSTYRFIMQKLAAISTVFVDFQVGCTLPAGLDNVFGGDLLAALLDMTGDVEERFEFGRDRSGEGIALDLLDQLLLLFSGAQIMRSYGAMDGLAIAAVVLSRDIGSDEFPLGERKGAGAAHENLC